MWNMKMAITELYSIFHFFNAKIYSNALPEPTLTIQSKGKRNALGWCSSIPIWADGEKKDKRYEINISAEYANRTVMEIAGTILHEMAHLYADINNIRDTSRGGTFHNKEFKKIAEKYGLVVKRSQRYGFAFTTLTEDVKKLVAEADFNVEAFLLARLEITPVKKKKKTSIKHVCPVCGNIARTTKEMSLICGNCTEDMDAENEDDDEDDDDDES